MSWELGVGEENWVLEVVGFRCCLSLCLGLQYQVGLQSGCWEEAACGSVVTLLWGGAAGLAGGSGKAAPLSGPG